MSQSVNIIEPPARTIPASVYVVLFFGVMAIAVSSIFVKLAQTEAASHVSRRRKGHARADNVPGIMFGQMFDRIVLAVIWQVDSHTVSPAAWYR